MRVRRAATLPTGRAGTRARLRHFYAMSEAPGGEDLMSALDSMETAEPLPADKDLAIRMNDSKLRKDE